MLSLTPLIADSVSTESVMAISFECIMHPSTVLCQSMLFLCKVSLHKNKWGIAGEVAQCITKKAPQTW